MHLLIHEDGCVTAIYGEDIDLGTLGDRTIQRASRVEPDATGNWWADLSPGGGPYMGPYRQRSDALAGEVRWLLEHLDQLK